MKNLPRIGIMFVICCLVLTGCWDEQVFERVGFILTAGIEASGDGKLYINYAYPAVGANQKNTVGMEITEATLLREARENARLSVPKFMNGGKTQQVLIADSLAKTGIHDIIEIFQRDVALPAIAYIVIVEGSPVELMKKASEFKQFPKLSYYLFSLIDNNVLLSNIPNTKVFDFDINYFAPGLDPVAPMIKLKKDAVEISGSALFAEDKMVGKLNQTQTLMLIGLMGQAKNTDYIISDPLLASANPGKYGIATLLHKPKRKIAISFDEEGIPIIDISMKYECVLTEYKWNDTNDPKEQGKLEAIIADHLKNHLMETVNILQKTNSDPIGIGDMIRAKYHEYWKAINWREIYPEAQINVAVKVEIVKEGLIK